MSDSPLSVFDFPSPDVPLVYNSLVGIDDVKERLAKEAEVILRPDLLEAWSEKFHHKKLPALELIQTRTPLFIFAGDVGTGKTKLATTFGDALARKIKGDVKLYSLSLKARGTGLVAEMTNIITTAFADFITAAKAANHGKTKRCFILHIDEADSLTQSRQTSQMHHEDRVGVNALIRGLDDVGTARCHCLVVMCTNRLDAMDPAVQRRAAVIFDFKRPNLAQRIDVLQKYLAETGLKPADIDTLAKGMGEDGSRPGFTYSDITERFVPSVIMAAYPDHKITEKLADRILAETAPSPSFLP